MQTTLQALFDSSEDVSDDLRRITHLTKKAPAPGWLHNGKPIKRLVQGGGVIKKIIVVYMDGSQHLIDPDDLVSK